jgi:hypothetical protein
MLGQVMISKLSGGEKTEAEEWLSHADIVSAL